MKAHEVNAHSNEPLSCKHCDLKGCFSDKDNLSEHIQNNHEKIFECSVCKLKFESLNSAREHFREAHPDRPLKCMKCSTEFPNMIAVHNHISNTHENMYGISAADEYTCNGCEMIFKTGMFF